MSTSSFCSSLDPSFYKIQKKYKTFTICKYVSVEKALQLNAPVGLYRYWDETQKC
jgi:hypothetical protein